MSNHSLGSAYATRTDPFRVLEEMKRLAVEQLNGLPGSLYGPIEDLLALSAPDRQRDAFQYQDQAALWGLRQHHATHVMRYRQHIAQGFDDFRTLRIRSRGELPMGLLDEAQLDMHVAGQRLAESVSQRYQRPLEMMEGRLRALGAVVGLSNVTNPIGPSRLATALVETFNDERIPAYLRTQLFGQYEQELARRLGDLYGKVNTLLATSGYAVVGVPAEPAANGEPGAAAASSHGGSGHWRNAPSSIEMQDLRAMLRAWREGAFRPDPVEGEHAPKRPQAPRRELRLEEVVSVASLLQSEPSEVFARALAGSGRLAGAIRDHLNDGSRRLGINPDQTRFSDEEEDAIDLVAMLFDSLFQNYRLQDRARRLYARLVLPFVKVALTDEGLFVRSTHPARRLLDALTEACDGNNAETPQERELLDRAVAASQRVVAEFNQDVAVFEMAHAEIDGLLQQQRRRIELQEERAAKTVLGRERLQHAREQADAVLSRRLAAPPLSAAMADFLATSWRHHLVQVLLREGVASQRFAEAVILGDSLVEADRLAAEGRGRELADRLLAMEPSIIDCLASSGVDDTAAQHGMALLVKTLAWPDAPRDLYPMQPSKTADDRAEELARWLSAEALSIPSDGALVERVRQVACGQWLQLTGHDGEASPVKVGWISPMTSRRLLVNNRGMRVLVASVDELAAMVRAGRLQLDVGDNAFDGAMRRVFERLDRAVGQR